MRHGDVVKSADVGDIASGDAVADDEGPIWLIDGGDDAGDECVFLFLERHRGGALHAREAIGVC